MSPERIVTETTEPAVARRGPGGLDPAVGVFLAILVAALIGLLIWFFAGRDSTDNDGGSGNPAPHSTSQQQDNNQPTEQPSTGSTP